VLRPSLIASFGGALALLACSRSEPPSPRFEVKEAPMWLAAPGVGDRGSRCADVRTARVCWTGDGAAGVVSVPIVPPPGPVPPRGFRCAGAASERRCRDRAFGSDDFSCTGSRCTQRHPRLPDDGEWECAELSGAVVCRGWSPAAGVLAGPADPGWLCGVRRGADPERICVDFSPDVPRADALCHFAYEPDQPKRICDDEDAPLLGEGCQRGCPLGSVCRSDRCLPLEPHPGCWTDRDCASHEKCALGSCLEVPR
jgi:hypothetical protein